MTADVLLIGLSGPTSSGKTTIASALATVLPSTNVILLHADDFYKPDSAIPTHPSGVADWDCADSLDLPRFRQTLIDLRAGGKPPDNLPKQGGADDDDDDGVHATLSGLSKPFLEKLQSELIPLQPHLQGRRIVLVEGFLLFGQGVKDQLARLFDLRILLRASREAARERRERRNGYVTLEGFWQDPEGYFDTVVWPNYVAQHAWLFEDDDVEGRAREGKSVSVEFDVLVGPVENASLEDVCSWVAKCLRDHFAAGEA